MRTTRRATTGFLVGALIWSDFSPCPSYDHAHSGSLAVVGVTKTEPLRELVWESRKDPDHERQEIHD